MSKIKLTGENSGYVEISAGQNAGNNTLELPTSGTKVVASDDSGNVNNLGIVTATTFSGNITGNITGNVTGDVTGNLTGDVTGNLTGDVTVAIGATISGSTNTIIASTNGSERVRITSAGDLNIGSSFDTSSASGFGIGHTITNVVNNRTGCIKLQADGFNNAYYNVLEVYNGNQLKCNIKADGNIVFASGSGIDFSATADGSGTSSSELFGDYEEGIWTPTYYLNGILQSSYAVNFSAKYLKIGKLVYLEFWLGFGAYGQTNFPSGANTPFEIGGLPYTINETIKPGSLGNARTQGGLSANFSIGANNAQRICFWGTGGNFSSWNGVGKLQANQISSSTNVVIAGSYSYYN